MRGVGRAEVSRASCCSASYADALQGSRTWCSTSTYERSRSRWRTRSVRRACRWSVSTPGASSVMAPSRRRAAALRHPASGATSSTRSPRPRAVRRSARDAAARRWPGTYSTVRPDAAASATSAASVPVTSAPAGASTNTCAPVATTSSTCCCSGDRSPTPRSWSGSRSPATGAGSGTASRARACSTPASAATTSCRSSEPARLSRSSTSTWPGWTNEPTMTRSVSSKSSRTASPSDASRRSAARGSKPSGVNAPRATAAGSSSAPRERSARASTGFTSSEGSRASS